MTGGSREIRAAALEATTTRDWAAQVLHHFGQGGYEAGSFRAHLIRAALGADRQNLGRIAAGFPELAAAIELSQDFDDGILRLRRVAGIDPRPGCPDGGTCHHQCPPTDTGPRPCFRVRNAGPLSGVYPLNVWPEAVRREHGAEKAHYTPVGPGDPDPDDVRTTGHRAAARWSGLTRRLDATPEPMRCIVCGAVERDGLVHHTDPDCPRVLSSGCGCEPGEYESCPRCQGRP